MPNRRFLLLGVLSAALWPVFAARAQVSAAEYAHRRDALLARLPDAVVVALGAHEPTLDYVSFYQTPSFTYLSGYIEPDAALVLTKTHGVTTTTLFVEPREPGREVWVGARLGVEGATQRTGMPARDVSDFSQVLDSLARTGLPMYVVGDFGGDDGGDHSLLTVDQQFVAARRRKHPGLVVKSAMPYVEQLRGTKSSAELALIRKAAEITARAEEAAMRALEPEMNEYEIQALVEYTFRRNGADRPSFASIIGSGPNATTLHYNADTRVIERGDVVVMDIGASYQGYAADVTRSIPANGTYLPDQRAVYQIVR